MKALTIWQPWASLIVAGAKPYEFRGWYPPASIIGQRIVIHAGAHKTAMAEIGHMSKLLQLRDIYPIEAGELCLKPDLAIPILQAAWDQRLPMSAGIGTAIVGKPRRGPDIATEFGVPRANDSDRDQHADWGWPMLEIEPWDEPQMMKGAQGLWNWPDAEQFAERL